MSKATSFDQVSAGIARYGSRATVITVGDDGRPHVVTSLIEIENERLVVGAGTRTQVHLGARPIATLVWNPEPGGEYLLIVDTNVDAIGAPDERGVARVVLAVDGAIQHRLAGLTSEASSCRPADAHV